MDQCKWLSPIKAGFYHYCKDCEVFTESCKSQKNELGKVRQVAGAGIRVGSQFVQLVIAIKSTNACRS